MSAHARQFTRHATEYEARIEPHPDHAEQFRLGFADAQTGMAVIDVSEGGLGLQSSVYVPKNMRLILHVSTSGADKEVHGRGLTIRGVVRRCIMVDQGPTYQVGLQFVDPRGHDERVLVESVTQATTEVEEPVTTGEVSDA